MEQEIYYYIRVGRTESYHKKWQKELAEFAMRYNATVITRTELPELVEIFRDAVSGVCGCEIVAPKFNSRFDSPGQIKFISAKDSSAKDYLIMLLPVFCWWNGGRIAR